VEFKLRRPYGLRLAKCVESTKKDGVRKDASPSACAALARRSDTSVLQKRLAYLSLCRTGRKKIVGVNWFVSTTKS
jgi:hypothetical protein